MSIRSAARVAAALAGLAALPALAGAPPPSSAGDQARFLAGLPVAAGSALEPLTQAPEWKAHQQAMDRAWPRLEARLAKATAFEQGSLAPRIQRDRKVVYFFGGPDAAHVVRLFPDAPAYLLAGLEAVGEVQRPEAMRPADVHRAIAGLADALKTIIDKSFFVTSDMGRELQGRGIRGVEPVLFIFLARSGAEVLDATYFEVSAAGVATDKAPGQRFGPGVPGVRIRFQFPGRPPQEMSYVRVNLHDAELARQPGFFTWAKAFAPANGLLKAASFILHDPSFSRPRAFLLEACAAILQDDSGVPYRVFRRSGWALTCFGRYHRPRSPFEHQEQKDLAEACAGQSGPIDFIIGYRRPSDSALQLYVKSPGASPLTLGAAPEARSRGAETSTSTSTEAPAASPLTPSVAPQARSRGAETPTPAVEATPAAAPTP